MLRKHSFSCVNLSPSSKELEMFASSKSYWFDSDFLRCVFFVCANGVFLAFCWQALVGKDYQWIVNAFFEGGICGLGVFLYRNYWPSLRWYRHAVRVLALVL